jgi:carbamoyl-phosphate synthase large subunit
MLKPEIVVFIPSGAGAPGFGGIASCLREDSRIRLIAGDFNPQAYGSKMADAFYSMPRSTSQEYISRIIEIIHTEKVDVILPITTAELEVLARFQSVLEVQGLRVIISPEKALQIANNKGELHLWANKLGIPVPEGGVVSSKSEFELLARQLFNQYDNLFFKPIIGNGSRGIGIVQQNKPASWSANKPELMPLTLEEWLFRFGEVFETPLLLTAYLPGKEYSVDAFLADHQMPIIVPRSRDKMVSGISVSGVFEEHLELIDYSKKLLVSLGLIGPIGIQWKLDEQGVPHLLEINPRLQGTTSTLRHLGINVPLIAVRTAMGEAISVPIQLPWGRSFTRYWKDVFL